MSCQVRLAANITDIGAIRRCLFPTDDLRGSDSWLQLCEISLSPAGDVIAIANERRLVILCAKWDFGSSLNKFHITYSGSVHESDNIKAVLCMPVVGETKNSHVSSDWTCVLLGFESGFVRFYTECCELLLEEHFHNEVIASVKCQSQHNPRSDVALDIHQEEIYIQYQSTICVIAGNELFPVLKNYRSELLKAEFKGESLELPQSNIVPKKWGFQDQAVINDSAVVGVNLHGTFDHLLTASTCGGFDTKYRSSAPYNNLVLAAGSRPFVGFHYALEGGPLPVFSDVAKVVATKLKSALPGWLTGSRSAVEKQMTVAMQPADSMGCRFGLCDLRRTAVNIILSADHKLAAVSDALGRVILMDAYRGIALKIFKGYRDAQCSFVQVPDERHSKHRIGNKVAVFLVIYSPKKGTLEIFTTQQGSKIATFSASKFSRLIYNSYGLMGFATTSKSRFVCPFTTLLVDNDGQIKEILIPFHFALSEKSSKRGRDIHLYKKLRKMLKNSDCGIDTLMEEGYSICVELKTVELKLQTLELLLSSKGVPAEFTLKCVQYFRENLETENEREVDNFRVILNNALELLSFYLFLKNVSNEEQGSKDADPRSEDNSVDIKLNLGDKQLKNLQQILDLMASNDNRKSVNLKVEFVEDEVFAASEFISTFNLKNAEVINLEPSQDDFLLFKTSKIIFQKYITGAVTDLDSFEAQIAQSKIVIKDLFVLLIRYWVNHPHDVNVSLKKELTSLYSVILVLVKAVAPKEIIAEYNYTSKFWDEIRDILANCLRPFPALTAAILCKIVSQQIENESEMTDSSITLEDENIEILTPEIIEWSLLIGKLEDVSLLNIVLSDPPAATHSTLPKLKHDKVEISLKHIIRRGKGSVSELAAQWLTLCGVNPENIVINDIIYRKEQEETEASVSSEDDDDDDALPEQDIPIHQIEEVKSERVFENLNLMKTKFPYSLDANYILTNMCWEYALAWQKDIQDLRYLEACITCLKHIPNSHIKEGLYNLVWNTHLKIIFESTCKLVNKVGKLPKERLCKQDTGLSDYNLAIFLEICTNFLDDYMVAVKQSCGVNKPVLQFEQIWENGPQPLVELALQQNAINYDLLHLHYQLSLSLQMITSFSIKHSKPVHNLFESYMVGLFFIDFQTKTRINWDYADSKVQSSRTEFLCKVISASLESVTVNENRIHATEHVKWMEKCLEIGKLWNLDTDLLRRHQLVQIYVHGFDIFGNLLVIHIEDRNKFGQELLGVACKRLSNFLSSSPNYCQNVSALVPAVTRYLEGFQNQWCAPSTLGSIESIAALSISCMEERTHEHKIGELLLDGCRTLLSIYKDDC